MTAAQKALQAQQWQEARPTRPSRRRIERQDEREDRNTLMIYRIMYNTNSMSADTDYIEMAQLLGDAALPGEAAAVLDKAMSTGVSIPGISHVNPRVARLWRLYGGSLPAG